MKYRHESTIGGKGSSPHQFASTLRGVTVGSGDHLFAVGDSEVKVFDQSGTLLRRWKTEVPGLCATVFEELVYVGQEGQLEIYDLQGKLQKTWRDSKLLGRVTAVQVQVSGKVAPHLRDPDWIREGRVLTAFEY